MTSSLVVGLGILLVGAAQLLEALIVVHAERLAHAFFAIHLVDNVVVHSP